MAKKVYELKKISLLDQTEFFAKPLSIFFLKELMDAFEKVKKTKEPEEVSEILIECAFIAMKQYMGEGITKEYFEEVVDMPTVYEILDISAGIKINEEKQETVEEQVNSEENSSWEKLDLSKLESEIFILGIWKNYEELERSISMPEMISILEEKREQEHQNRKFFAALKGVDLDKQSGQSDAWEDLKARVFSKGQAKSGNDILALQGRNAEMAGFGIGMGLNYEKLEENRSTDVL